MGTSCLWHSYVLCSLSDKVPCHSEAAASSRRRFVPTGTSTGMRVNEMRPLPLPAMYPYPVPWRVFGTPALPYLQFLSLALDTHPTVLQECWAALCHHIWHSHVHTQGWGSSDLLDIFLSHGTALGIGMFSLILIMHSAHLVISRLL